jgi:hypothetical protein
MGYVPYVGFVTYRRATVKICLYFKRLIFMQMFCIKKNNKKKVVTLTKYYPEDVIEGVVEQMM